MNNAPAISKTWLTYLLIGAALLFTLNAFALKYAGQVLLPLLKALLLLSAIYIYGFFSLDLFKFDKDNIDLSTAFAVGLIFTTFFFFLAGFLKILSPAVITTFYLVPAILLFFMIKNPTHSLSLQRSVRSFFQRSPLQYPAFFLPFIYACLPSSFYDSLVYHLGIPNLYLQHGGFVETPQFLFANTSIYYEISLIPAVFAGDAVPRLFHFLVGVIFLLAAADFAKEVFHLQKPHIFLLLTISMPMSIFLLSTVKSDLAGAFFIFLGIRYLLKKRYAFSALFWGFATGCKYFNALALVIFLAIFFILEKRFPFKKIAIFGLVVIAVLAPLLAKNYIYAHNPFFPFFSRYFTAEFWDASRHALMKADIGKMIHSVRDAVKLPYTVSFGSLGFGGVVGAQFLIFLPFLLVTRERLKEKWLLLGFAILTLYAGSFFTGSLRFLYIVFIFLSVYLAVVYESVALNREIVKYLLFIVVFMNFAAALAAQEQMYPSVQLFYGDSGPEEYKASVFPTYPGIAYVNQHAKPGAQVMLVGEARNYYLHRPYLVSSGIDYPILKKYLQQTDNADAFIAALKNRNIDYIILNLGEFNRLQREYRGLDETGFKKMGSFLSGMQSKMVFQQKGIFVFKLSPGPVTPLVPGSSTAK